MAIFGLIATTWVDQMSARDSGCTDDVRCAADFSLLGLVPLADGPDATYAPNLQLRPSAPQSPTTFALRHQQPVPTLGILTVAPKTSPPA